MKLKGTLLGTQYNIIAGKPGSRSAILSFYLISVIVFVSS